ncbi:MAG: ankyrin repeat domain-containing protein, partial [Spirochaetota bacterium]
MKHSLLFHTAVICMIFLSYGVLSPQEAPDILAAAKAGKSTDVTLALSGGADINVRDANGATALMWASLRGFKDTVTVLLAA